jgi:hypothetical protein
MHNLNTIYLKKEVRTCSYSTIYAQLSLSILSCFWLLGQKYNNFLPNLRFQRKAILSAQFQTDFKAISNFEIPDALKSKGSQPIALPQDSLNGWLPLDFKPFEIPDLEFQSNFKPIISNL